MRWPDGARLAFAVVVSAEYYEMQPAPANFIPANVPGGFGRAPYPDVRAFSQRDYGNRVGVFRVIEALERFAIPATAAIDADVATRYPYIVEQFRKRGFEIAGHGHAVTNVISNHMAEAEERGYIASALETLQAWAGRPRRMARPGIWRVGADAGAAGRAWRRLRARLAERRAAVSDAHARLAPLVSLAMALELDDVVTMWHRRVSGERWRQAVSEALDQLLADGARGGRHLILNLHPWLIGHPHRIGYLEDVLDDVRRRASLMDRERVGDCGACLRGQLKA